MTGQVAGALAGWTPVRVEWRGQEPVVEWCFTAGRAFDEPFFDQTITRCRREPFSLLFPQHTDVSAMAAVAASGDALPLAGLVFHSSRCGSTLVAQMLNSLRSVLVMSEPAPLQGAVAADWACPTIDEQSHLELIRATVGALAQRRDPRQRQLVVKLDAWSVLHLPLVLNAVPGVPWVYLYRDPVEVLVSHAGHRGWHMVPGTLPPAAIGLGEGAPVGPEEYMARVLGALLAAAGVSKAGLGKRPAGAATGAAAGPGAGLLVNYRELPQAVHTRIARHFGLELSGADHQALADAARRDAKNPSVAFEDDSRRKQDRATPALRHAARRSAQPAYEKLERGRATQIEDEMAGAAR